MPPERSYDDSAVDNSDNGESPRNNNDGSDAPSAKRRRVFLQTMGQQLREVGVGNGSDGNLSSLFTENGGEAAPSGNTPGSEHRSTRQVHIQTPESDAVPGEDDHTSTGVSTSAIKALWRPGEVVVSPHSQEHQPLDFDDMIDWTRSYFDHWHPAFPFLHAPTILEYFDKLVDSNNPTRITAHELTIVRTITSISLADSRQTKTNLKPVPQYLVFTSLNDAIQSVQTLLVEESTILALQAVVSVQLFLISMLRYNAASRLEGLASRMAFHLGLHRCPRRFSTFPPREAELRQRLFWSMYCIDRYICIRLGIPLAIRDADVDTCFPTSERHISGTEEIHSKFCPLTCPQKLNSQIMMDG